MELIMTIYAKPWYEKAVIRDASARSVDDDLWRIYMHAEKKPRKKPHGCHNPKGAITLADTIPGTQGGIRTNV